MSISPLQCSSCSVLPALCTLHCERVELSDHFMSICTYTLQCAVKFDAHCSSYTLHFELSEHFVPICRIGIVHCVCVCVHYAVCTVYFERVELSEHFMSICRGLDVSPTLLRLPPPICVLLSFSTFSSLNIEHRDSLAKRSSPSYLCATLLFYSQHFLHFLY